MSRSVGMAALVWIVAQACAAAEPSESMRRAIESFEQQAEADANQISEVLERPVVGVYAGHIVTEYLENVVAACQIQRQARCGSRRGEPRGQE